MKNRITIVFFAFIVAVAALAAEKPRAATGAEVMQAVRSLVTVTGRVQKPGAFHPAAGKSVWDAIEACGGITFDNWGHSVVVMREASERLRVDYRYKLYGLKPTEIAEFLKSIRVQPGDYVYVIARYD